MSGYGGTEKILNTVINYYAKDETNCLNLVSFYSVSGIKWCDADIKTIDILSRKKKNNVVLAFSLFSFFIKADVDKVIVTNQLALPIIKYARKFNSHKFEIISWVHFDLVQGPMSSDRKISAILTSADKFISLSDSNSNLLSSKGFTKENIYTVYNPVDLPPMIIPKSNDGIYRFIYVGRLQFLESSQKNNKEFFDALTKVKDLNWILDIYGDGEDIDIEKKYVSKAGLSDKVVFHGWTTNPFEKIEQADCLVMTSTFEGFPLTLVESLSYGLPAVSSNINGPNEIINENNGVLYDRGNIQQLSSILENLVKGEIVFDQELIRSSCDKFSSNNYFTKFDKVFDRGNNE